MKKITFLFVAMFCFAFTWQSNAQHTFTSVSGPTNVAGGTPVNISINDAANAAGAPAGTYTEFFISVDWVNGYNAWSSEADLTVVTSAGSVLIDPATSGAADSTASTTLTFSGSFTADYDPSVDGTLDIILGQSYDGSDANWSNITLTILSGPVAAPECATTPTPNDGASDVQVGNITLSWSAPASGPTPTAYNIYAYDDALGTNPGLVLTTSTTSADVVVDAYGIEVFWAAVPVNLTEEATGCDIWSFTTVELLNDECVDAIAVTCDDTVTGNTEAATDSAGNTANDVWYSFTGTGTPQDVTVDLCASDYDTLVRVFDACGGAEIALNDDSCEAQSSVTFPSDGTSTYYIMVEGYDSGFGFPASGIYSMTITCEAATPPPANNECADAVALTFTTSVTGTTVGATQNLAEEQPSCDPFGAIADVWYSVTLATSGDLSINTTLDTATQANVAIYSACGGLEADEIACSDDLGGESVTATDLTAGTYYIRVWNNGGSEEGTFNIVADFTLSTADLNNANEFTYFPNPVKNTLQLNAQSNIQNVSIFNMLGQEVLRTAPNNVNSTVDMSALLTGAYFVKVTINDRTETVRVIKQ